MQKTLKHTLKISPQIKPINNHTNTGDVIYSHDDNSVFFVFDFEGESGSILQLDETYTAVVHIGGNSYDMTLVGNTMMYEVGLKPFSTGINKTTVYLYKDGASVDAGGIYFRFELSSIDNLPPEKVEHYVSVLEKLKEKYNEALEQLDVDVTQVISDFDTTANNAIDSKIAEFDTKGTQAIGDLGEVTATVEIAEASRVEKESERVQAETERTQAEQARKEAETERELAEGVRWEQFEQNELERDKQTSLLNDATGTRLKYWAGSQAEYDAIGTYDLETVYDIW